MGRAYGTLDRVLPVAHLDLDAFFAAVEERQKPSLRGRPVVVAGLGHRGVVATANYAARALGVHSAMPTWQARALAPLAAWLSPRHDAYAAHSAVALAPVFATFERVEQVAFDEVYVDLRSARPGPGPADWAADPYAAAEALREAVLTASGLSCSVGVARHKLGAKLASEAAKPGGVRVLDLAAEEALLPELPVRALPGIGPVSAGKLTGTGISTVAELRRAGRPTVVALLGTAHGGAMWDIAHGVDVRAVEAERERKSVGAERTFAADVHGLAAAAAALQPVFDDAYARLLRSASATRTVTAKIRYADFSIETRAASLPLPSDDETVLRDAAVRALRASGVGAPGALGVRLLGVSFSNLADTTQLTLGAPERHLPADAHEPEQAELDVGAPVTEQSAAGADVLHPELGRGWLVGAGHGVASVRFESARTPPARTRSLPLDGTLRHAPPEPPLEPSLR